MSTPGSPHHARPPAQPDRSATQNPAPDPERVLAQALRAMAGGGRPNRTAATDRPDEDVGSRLTVLQIALMATILGLLVGMTAGLITLLA